MAGTDVSQTKTEAAQANKQRRHLQLKEKQESEIAALDQNISLELSDLSSSTDDVSDVETEEAVEKTAPQWKMETWQNQHHDPSSPFIAGQDKNQRQRCRTNHCSHCSCHWSECRGIHRQSILYPTIPPETSYQFVGVHRIQIRPDLR